MPVIEISAGHTHKTISSFKQGVPGQDRRNNHRDNHISAGLVQCLQYRDRAFSPARNTGVSDYFLEGVLSEHCPFPSLEGRHGGNGHGSCVGREDVGK